MEDCLSDKYGQTNADLFDEIGVFTVDDDVEFIFAASGSDVALDNLQFELANASDSRRLLSWKNESDLIMFATIDGTALIVDSVIEEVELLVNDS